MNCCCVPHCKYTSKNCEGITFHAFPTKEIPRAAWLRILNKNESQISEESVVCSKHFLFTDFYLEDGTKKLRYDALPSVVQVCLICLETDNKLVSITKHKLKQAYEDLTGLMLCKEASICMECSIRLKKFKTFRDKSLRANSIIAELVEKHKILRIQDVKTVNREINNLTSNLVQKIFKPNHCDVIIFEYLDNDEQTVESTKYSYDLNIKVEDNERINNMFLIDYVKDEDGGNGYEYDYEDNIELKKEGNAIGTNDSTDTMWLEQSDDDIIDTEYLLPDFSSEEQKFAIKLEIKDGESVMNCLICDEVFSNKELFKEHSKMHSNLDESCDSTDSLPADTSWKFSKCIKKNIMRNVHKHLLDHNTLETPLRQANITDIKENCMFTGCVYKPSEQCNKLLRCIDQQDDKLYIIDNRKTSEIVDDNNEVSKCNAQSNFDDQEVLQVLSYNKCNTKENTTQIKSTHSTNVSKRNKLILSYDTNDNIRTDRDALKNVTPENMLKKKSVIEKNFSKKLDNKRTQKVSNDYEKSHFCHVCSRNFTKNSALHIHMKVHYKDKLKNTDEQHVCHVCSQTFTNTTELAVHLKTHGEIDENQYNPYTCGICERKFTDKGNLKKHMKTHAGKKTYACGHCDYNTISYKFLLKHKKTHANPNERLLMCDICSKTFANKYNLRSHMKLHTGENMFTCDYCGKKFALKWNLVFHLRTHTGEKPFTCELCQYNFSSANNLKRHWKIHTGEKPYSCPLCSYRCIQSNTLRTHMRTHTGEKPFACEFCDYKCTERRTLRKHIKIHTEEHIENSNRIDIKVSDVEFLE